MSINHQYIYSIVHRILNLWLPVIQSMSRTVAQDPQCNAVIESSYWCHISPPYYAIVNVSETQPRTVVCTIPQSTGQAIYIKNHFGEDVLSHPILKNYVYQTSDPSSVPWNTQESDSNKRNYDVEISWTSDTGIQERLRILQCEALFHQTNYVCKTSVVNVKFIQAEPEGTFYWFSWSMLWNAIIHGYIVLSGCGNLCVTWEICMKDVKNYSPLKHSWCLCNQTVLSRTLHMTPMASELVYCSQLNRTGFLDSVSNLAAIHINIYTTNVIRCKLCLLIVACL